ncbi:hypothetical protein J2X43_002847 [Rhizobium sp. BE258]|nr:hypothetical protein [Rhizobium sp. BE258]
MAETNSSVLFLARWKGEAPRSFAVSRAPISALIPVLVTGIQSPRVCAAERLLLQSTRVIHGADAPWLDSCDEHRNEGVQGERRTFAAGLCA